jgi:hypothetical protein
MPKTPVQAVPVLLAGAEAGAFSYPLGGCLYCLCCLWSLHVDEGGHEHRDRDRLVVGSMKEGEFENQVRVVLRL